MGIGGWIVVGVIVLVLLYVIGVYNRLVRLRALVKEAFSGITVQLRRRADLVPNLVETVQGYATHERSTLDEVTRLRGATTGGGVQQTAAADAQMTGLLGRLMVVAEAYPELKADANFRDLQDKLAGVEDEIQLSRRYYNGAVRNLNTMIESFPTNFIANFFRFEKAEFFEIGDAAAREVPRVDFKK